MTGAALMPFAVVKEVRALWVPWLVCLAVMLVPAVADAPGPLAGVPAFAYFLGAAALGALSIGHEYSGRTLPLLFSLPARRERLLLVKLAVLGAMLLTLWLVADIIVFEGVLVPLPAVPALCGLLLAPWLTMAFRNPIAGAMFTMAVPVLLSVVGEWLGTAMYGPGREMAASRVAFLWRGTLGLCAIGGVMGWWMFMRLEAIDGSAQEVSLPRWLRRRAVPRTAEPTFRRRNPVWMLAAKELHLQQMTLVFAGLHVLAWLALPEDAFSLLTLFYTGMLALLIGSVASAGERQLGTVEWQMLQPLATSTQWAIKLSVVFGLAALLTLGLPAVYAWRTPGLSPNPFLQTGPVLVIALITAVSLYVSSLSRSGLWALLMSIPATFGAMLFFGIAVFPRLLGRGDWSRMNSGDTRLLSLLLIAGFVTVLLRFAFSNHRSAEPAAGRAWKQSLLIAAVVAVEVMLLDAIYRG